METEIKFLLSRGARERLEADPLIAEAEGRTTRLVSTYHDTPDLALRTRGAILRIRETPDGAVQTVKGPVRGDAFARSEWETRVGSTAVDRDALRREPEACALVRADLDRLRPVFETRVTRTARRIRLEGATEIEVSFDEGEIRAGTPSAAIAELELELKTGPPSPLYRFAADLARRHGLRLGTVSKAERGYALLGDALPPPHGGADPALPGDVTLADAFQRLMAIGARDLAADLADAARGEVEGVHRLRAAIRRLRTLLVLFHAHLDRPAATRFDRDLRGLGRVLGAGRDWDVFLTETLADADVAVGPGVVATLRVRAAGRSAATHRAVAETLDGPLPTELLLGLALWTAGRGWLGDPDDRAADAPLIDRLPRLLGRLARRVAARGRRLRSRDDEELHDLRKAMKVLRYAADDVASLYPRKAVAAHVGRIRAVLGDLGRINDAAVTHRRLADLAAPGDPEGAAAIAALGRWNERRRKRAIRDLRRRWREFRRCDPFWS